jgi:hypothetical protein
MDCVTRIGLSIRHSDHIYKASAVVKNTGHQKSRRPKWKYPVDIAGVISHLLYMSAPYSVEETAPAIFKGNPRGSGYERAEHEWYVEQPSAVRALLRHETFRGPVHDPACGGGNIPRTLREAGYYTATGADIVDRGFGEVRDFLTDQRRYANIVTNPPFKLAVDFAERAIASLDNDAGKVCIIQRLAWLEGNARYQRLFEGGLLHRVWVFRSRISMPPGGVDVPAKNGSVAYAWFVFLRIRCHQTALEWL